MNPDPSDLMDRLDLSMSSIDMTNTSLAMHEEKEGDISGVGEFTLLSCCSQFKETKQKINGELFPQRSWRTAC